MRRRDFSQVATLSATALAFTPSWSWAQAGLPKEGVDYLKLSRPAPVDAPAGKIEVIEFFWYNCPHCAKLEPTFDAWAKRLPADVALRRVPVAFRDDNVPQQRLFYALEAMGKLEELHARVFIAIHVEKQRLTTGDDIANWVVKQGIDKTKFMEFYNAFGVAGKARRATQLAEAYQVDGVPSLGVAGRFYTSGTLAQTMERSLLVTEHLIDRVRKGA
jgi:thiol:disulfide interchange protein DsbA